MGKARDALENFINAIPMGKLTGFSTSAGTIHRDRDFRFDMQGMTSNREFNLQIQANKETKITSMQNFAPKAVTHAVLIGEYEEVTAEQVRSRLRANLRI